MPSRTSKPPRGLVFSAFCAALLAAFCAVPRAHAHSGGDDAAKPAAKLRVEVIPIPGKRLWKLRLVNDDSQRLRIPADVRLLRFEVEGAVTKKRWGKTSVKSGVCDGPSAFGLSRRFPTKRELVLSPGRAYVERFDPRLICFGKKADWLKEGRQVQVHYGFAPPRRRKKGTLDQPYVVDGTEAPRTVRPARRVKGNRFTIPARPQRKRGGHKHPHGPGDAHPQGHGHKHPHGHGHKHPHGPKGGQGSGAGPAPHAHAPIPAGALGAAMTLTTTRYADVRHARNLRVSVEAHNVGGRRLHVALRGRQLAFKVLGPDGVRDCPVASADHHVPRDLFRKLEHGKHIHMNVMLAELCPRGTFARPGLYRAVPRLHANASGKEYGLRAVTGVVTVRDPGKVGGTHVEDMDATLIRVRRGSQPFYSRRPRPARRKGHKGRKGHHGHKHPKGGVAHDH